MIFGLAAADRTFVVPVAVMICELPVSFRPESLHKHLPEVCTEFLGTSHKAISPFLAFRLASASAESYLLWLQSPLDYSCADPLISPILISTVMQSNIDIQADFVSFCSHYRLLNETFLLSVDFTPKLGVIRTLQVCMCGFTVI